MFWKNFQKIFFSANFSNNFWWQLIAFDFYNVLSCIFLFFPGCFIGIENLVPDFCFPSVTSFMSAIFDFSTVFIIWVSNFDSLGII